MASPLCVCLLGRHRRTNARTDRRWQTHGQTAKADRYASSAYRAQDGSCEKASKSILIRERIDREFVMCSFKICKCSRIIRNLKKSQNFVKICGVRVAGLNVNEIPNDSCLRWQQVLLCSVQRAIAASFLTDGRTDWHTNNTLYCCLFCS